MKNIRKKISALVIAAFFLALTPGLTQAKEPILPDPGLTPANPFYFLDVFGEWVRTNALTFNDDNRALQQLDHAEERVAEMKKLAGEGKLKAKYAAKLSEKYQKLIEKYEQQIQEKILRGEYATKLEEKLKDIIAKHIDTLESLEDEINDDAAENHVGDALDTAEDEDDNIHEREFENEDSDADFAAEVQKKITKAQAEIAAAETFLATEEAAGEDASADRTRIEKAKNFLAQSQEALEDQRYDVAYALARQAREIAKLIQRPDSGKKVFIDDLSEKAVEEIIKAEEKITEAQNLLQNTQADEATKATATTFINEASNFVTQARTALEQD